MKTKAHLYRAPSWLTICRWLLLTFTITSFGFSLLGILRFSEYTKVHLDEFIPVPAIWTLISTQTALAELGWPATTFAWFTIFRGIFGAVIGMGFALFVLGRKKDGFGLYIAFTFVFFGFSDFKNMTAPLQGSVPGLDVVIYLTTIGWQFFFILMYIFPDGQFVPRWTRWLPLGWLAVNLLALPSPTEPPLVSVLLSTLLVFIAIGSQVYRYFWRAEALQRQQTKWVIFVLVMELIILFPANYYNLTGNPGKSGADLISTLIILAVNVLFTSLVPFAIVIAILRYRLWDIDVIIRRTLQYTLLTGLLALTYFGSILLIQNMFFGAQTSEIAIVLSTLAIAALFNPLRRRIQDFIDRRFYRKKYNAEQALARFAAVARDEVDMDKLTTALLGVVEETMQPERVTLWLKGSNLQAHKHKDSAGENTA